MYGPSGCLQTQNHQRVRQQRQENAAAGVAVAITRAFLSYVSRQHAKLRRRQELCAGSHPVSVGGLAPIKNLTAQGGSGRGGGRSAVSQTRFQKLSNQP